MYAASFPKKKEDQQNIIQTSQLCALLVLVNNRQPNRQLKYPSEY